MLLMIWTDLSLMVGGVELRWLRDRGRMAAETDDVPDQDLTPAAETVETVDPDQDPIQEIDNDLTDEIMMTMLLDRFLEKILLIREIEEEGQDPDLLERNEMIEGEIGLIADLMNEEIESLRGSEGVDLLVMILGIDKCNDCYVEMDGK